MIILGLGNPGEKFQNTRHNVGFAAIDKIAANFQFPIFNFKSSSNAEISQGEIAGEKVILAKPQTFMNESGKAVKKIMANQKLELAVIHDDIDLELGQIKIVKNRGSAGHKGVESIIKELGNKDFIRIRIGIKNGAEKEAIDVVLEKFSSQEKEVLKKVLEKSCSAIESLLKNGLEKTMQEYNK